MTCAVANSCLFLLVLGGLLGCFVQILSCDTYYEPVRVLNILMFCGYFEPAHGFECTYYEPVVGFEFVYRTYCEPVVGFL